MSQAAGGEAVPGPLASLLRSLGLSLQESEQLAAPAAPVPAEPTFTVVVHTQGWRRRTLLEALQSLAAQTWTNNSHKDFQPSLTKSGEAAAVIASEDLTVQLIDPLPATVEAARGDFETLSSRWDHDCGSLQNRVARALCWGASASGLESAHPEARTDASAGAAHSCALDSRRAVICWGSGFQGQTDAPEGSFQGCRRRLGPHMRPKLLRQHRVLGQRPARLGESAIRTVHSYLGRRRPLLRLGRQRRDHLLGPRRGRTGKPASGALQVDQHRSAHSCALDETGTITCWGANWFGQTDTPEGGFVAVAAGYGHTCALDEGALATCWGLNNDYQANAPHRVFTTITAGRSHTCALDIHAEVMCWGAVAPATNDVA